MWCPNRYGVDCILSGITLWLTLREMHPTLPHLGNRHMLWTIRLGDIGHHSDSGPEHETLTPGHEKKKHSTDRDVLALTRARLTVIPTRIHFLFSVYAYFGHEESKT